MKPLLLSCLLLTALISCAQPDTLRTKLYKLDDRIIAGDREALKEMALYLDNKRFVQEFLGYHNYPNSARGIAIRVLNENCLFQRDEFSIDSTVSTKKFLSFLSGNKVVFDVPTGRFLVTNLGKRTTRYQLRNLSKSEMEYIDSTVIKFPFPSWYYENQIDWFLKNKDSQALFWIASAWYNKRSRFNRYYFADEVFLGLMKSLTHLDLGVPDEKGQMTFLYKDDYYDKARLNYLVYWQNHYEDYQWNEDKGYFINVKERGIDKTTEEIASRPRT